MGVEAVVFDVGGTLVDETRIWQLWADWLSVPRLTFLEALHGAIVRHEHHRSLFERLRPGFDVEAERMARVASGWADDLITMDDFYPDAIECLTELHKQGFRVGTAANQPATTERLFANLAIPLTVVASSERWGIEKPSAAFFERLIAELGLSPDRIAYVGDRVDNDVIPAAAAGLKTVFLRRGPWGEIHSHWPEVALADLRLDNLKDLPARIREI
jgi:HAD superfamily hydrolase (TIGR01549 family)